MLVELLFWLSLSLLLYIYAGYPLLALLLSAGRPAVEKSTEHLPAVSILIAAYNEEGCIRATLRNKIELDYPRDRLEIIVVSDESSDRTDQIVRDFAATSEVAVSLIRQQPRQGKT